MFTLKDIPDITVDVPVQVPGEKKASSLQATWTLHDWDEYRKKAEELREGKLSDDDVLKDLVSLGGIKDEKGKALEYSDDLLKAVLKKTYVRRPLLLSWFAAQEGRQQAAAKN